MNSKLLDYPVLAISAEDTAVVHINHNSLTSTNTGGIRRGYYDRLRLITSSGDHYLVNGHSIVNKATLWDKFNPFSYKSLRVDLALSRSQATSLDDIKTILISNLHTNEYFGEVVDDMRKAEHRLLAAVSARDLIAAFHDIQEGRA